MRTKKSELQKDIIIQKLRRKGCRITKQRLILLDIILEGDCMSCKEIYYKAHTIDSSIGMATVYRMINLLEDAGLFSRENFYKVSCDEEQCKKVYRVEFEDMTQCRLSEKQWKQVISEGLKVCSKVGRKKVAHVEVEVETV